jgi:hypothetical protein
VKNSRSVSEKIHLTNIGRPPPAFPEAVPDGLHYPRAPMPLTEQRIPTGSFYGLTTRGFGADRKVFPVLDSMPRINPWPGQELV